MHSDPRLMLALEGSTATVSAAILRGEVLLGEVVLRADQAHAERILPAIDQVLHDTNLSLDAIEAFAVAVGPGGFTSLRITVATLKGLAFATSTAKPQAALPVAAVSTLEALAFQAMAQGVAPATGEAWLVPMLDARRDEVYAAAYRPDPTSLAGVREVLPESVYTAEELGAKLAPQALLLGEGAALVGETLGQALGSGVRRLPEFELRASSVGKLGARLLAQGAGISAEALAPHYLRRAEAEVKRTGLRFEAAP